MKALFSRMRRGAKPSKDDLVAASDDRDSETRSFRDKAQPPLPTIETSSSSLSLSLTPDLASRELPPIISDANPEILRGAALSIPPTLMNAPRAEVNSASSLSSGNAQRTSVRVTSAAGTSSSSKQASPVIPAPTTTRASAERNTAITSATNTSNTRPNTTSSSTPSATPSAGAASGRVPSGGEAASGSGSGTHDPATVSKKVAFISPPPTSTSLASPLGGEASYSNLNSPASIGRVDSTSTTMSASSPSRVRSPALSMPRGGAPAANTNPSGSGSATPNGRHVSDPPVRMGGYTPSLRGGPPNTSRINFNPSTGHLNELPTARSGTPMSYMSSMSGIQAAASWSEVAEEDLVSNLGPRERTRQEVLFEIVASEERYVVELLKLKETFIDPLLHPYSTAPVGNKALVDPLDETAQSAYYRAETPMTTHSRNNQPRASLEDLPIASRFITSPTPEDGENGNQRARRKRSNLHRKTGATAPANPDDAADVDSLGGPSGSEDEEDDEMGRGYARGANRLPVLGSPYGGGGGSSRPSGFLSGLGKGLPFPTGTGARSHQSLPPPPRISQQQQQQQPPNPARVSTTSLGMGNNARPSNVSGATLQPPQGGNGRGSPVPRGTTPTGRFAKKFLGGSRKESVDSHAPTVTMPLTPGGYGVQQMSPNGSSLAPHLLPEDLRICLEVLESGILQGHITLSDGLRKRYEEQYPLVRSLADVFVSNSHILRGYATYVLHLERALEQVDDALSSVSLAKKPKKQDIADWIHVSRVLRQLEEVAAEKGETGLAISLSKPFQRLLKYPLLFQNLLFHTDPSTFEYESTLEMVAEVEKIVRSIEDEKIQKEERDKTRDVIARIEGLEKNKALAAPKPSRQLVQERPLVPPTAPPSAPPSSGSRTPKTGSPAKAVQPKSSFRRLSDVLQPGGTASNPTMGGKKDLWLVSFNDVVLRCQRTGTTTLPLASSPPADGAPGRAHSLPELQSKGKYNTVGRRSVTTKPRNLYKFIKIETWTIGDVVQPKSGVVAMEDISRARTQGGVELEKHAETEEGEEAEVSDDSDQKSKMSFSYWGADKITVQRPGAKARGKAAAKNAIAARRGPVPSAYSAANAKFGTRLRSPEPGEATRSNSHSRRGPTPNNNTASLRKPSTETRPPAWGSMGNARPNPTPVPPIVARRAQKLSTPTPPKPELTSKAAAPSPSPAPSEDSGVAQYRDMMAQHPSFNRSSDAP